MTTKELIKATGAKPEQIFYLRGRGMLVPTNAESVNGAGAYYDYPDKAVEIVTEWLAKRARPAKQ
ncbi:MAG: hypothetical protein BWX60_01090 [Candidatus Marinimicrobia bacterium ADurb.Bin030]|nr:MAG: hypothetical protein BWX60_01090 [Candidatus Marinimicrobia bacterium ADurb.Bin030]